jgi:hypothetical protein
MRTGPPGEDVRQTTTGWAKRPQDLQPRGLWICQPCSVVTVPTSLREARQTHTAQTRRWRLPVTPSIARPGARHCRGSLALFSNDTTAWNLPAFVRGMKSTT